MCVSMCAHVSMDLKMESDFMALCSKYENHLLLLSNYYYFKNT